MIQSNRRTFIKHSSIVMAALAFNGSVLAYGNDKKNKQLCFSTLGCPKWSLPDIIKFAAKNNYQGVEIRTIQGELDLNKCPEFSASNINATKRMFADNNLKITDLGSSATMHFADKIIRQKNMDEGKKFIDLAEKLDSPYIRVFPNNLPKNEDTKATLDTIVENLNELGNYAKDSHVKVLMESHGDVVVTKDLLYIMELTAHNNVGMIWDIVNMWSVTKQPPADVYEQLKKYIYHVHVKDMRFVNGKELYVLLGKGEAPVKEAIQLLYKNNYKGFYSFEWEKMWHPEIEEPEVALSDYPKKIKKYFN